MSETFTLTESELLTLYFSGYLSGAATVMRAYDVPTEESFAAARDLVGQMMADPSCRESVLDLHRAGGGAIDLPVPPAGRSAEGEGYL